VRPCGVVAGQNIPPAGAIGISPPSLTSIGPFSVPGYLSIPRRGTLALSSATRVDLNEHHRPFAFSHVSTDEVYGTRSNDPPSTEATPLAPRSPYSASKAGADLLSRRIVRPSTAGS